VKEPGAEDFLSKTEQRKKLIDAIVGNNSCAPYPSAGRRKSKVLSISGPFPPDRTAIPSPAPSSSLSAENKGYHEKSQKNEIEDLCDWSDRRLGPGHAAKPEESNKDRNDKINGCPS